jgi:hypothetical protein
MEGKEKLFQMYESLSAGAVRWGMSPYTTDRIEKWWLSNLQNLTPIVALHGDKIVGHAQIFKRAHARRKGTADLGDVPSPRLPQCWIGCSRASKAFGGCT